MNTTIKTLLFLGLFSMAFFSCEKEEDEGEELDIKFKMEDGYTYSDQTIATGTTITIGIEADTEKPTDPIIRFNISESVNGVAASSVYSEDIETSDYSHDYSFTLDDATSGNTHGFTFTIVNRDGKSAQASLTITVD